jgi:enamine deaminase RidA (YjgF/YER057c/UK114 family)
VTPDFVDPPGLFPGAPYHYAAIASAGRTVFTAGACPLDADGRVAAPGDLAAQTRQAVANLFAALAEAGGGVKDVVKTTVFVAGESRADLVAAWDVVEEAFAPARPPSTLLGVSFLGYPDQLVEIEAIAVIG